MKIEKGKPITLPDGTILLPDENSSGSKVVSVDEQEQNKAAYGIAEQINALLETPFKSAPTSVKRTLADVTVAFNQMNVVMLVYSYTLWGLDAFAISKLMNIPAESVDHIRISDLYTQIEQDMTDALRHAEEATVHGFIQSKALAAATVVVSSLTSKSEDNRITAAKDILDRSGFRPVDRVEHSMKFEDELRIRYVSEPAIPTIDLTPEK
jgi:hypothetical protein